MAEIKGQCLCGAVQVSAQTDAPKLRACHCEMCRQHTSGAFFSIKTVPGSEVVAGPATSFRSSDWAEQGVLPDLWVNAVVWNNCRWGAAFFCRVVPQCRGCAAGD